MNLLKIIQEKEIPFQEEKSSLHQLRKVVDRAAALDTNRDKKECQFACFIFRYKITGILSCEIAIESSRKGNKMDMSPSHIALQVETQIS